MHAQKLQLRRLLPAPFLDSAARNSTPAVTARYLPSPLRPWPAPAAIPSPRPREAQVSTTVGLGAGGGRTPPSAFRPREREWGQGSLHPRASEPCRGKRVCKRESMGVPIPFRKELCPRRGVGAGVGGDGQRGWAWARGCQQVLVSSCDLEEAHAGVAGEGRERGRRAFSGSPGVPDTRSRECSPWLLRERGRPRGLPGSRRKRRGEGRDAKVGQECDCMHTPPVAARGSRLQPWKASHSAVVAPRHSRWTVTRDPERCVSL